MGEKLSETGSAFCGLPSFVCLVTGAKAGSLSLHSPVEAVGPGLAHFLNELFLLKLTRINHPQAAKKRSYKQNGQKNFEHCTFA